MENNSTSNKDQLVLVNIIEEFVRIQVRHSMKEHGACQCETCYLNACALALNDLAPKYVTTTKGALLAEISAMEPNNHIGILVAVTKAVMLVAETPHH